MTPHDYMVPPKDPRALLEDTWNQYHRLRATGPRIIVRTWEIPEKIGHIVIPATSRRFYQGLPHTKLVKATVLSVPTAYRHTYTEGQYVAFSQTFFARLATMVDGTFVGVVHAKYLLGEAVLDRGAEAEIDWIRNGHACAA